MEQKKMPAWMLGAIIGALLTVSLTAISYLGQQILGLPFVPFAFFDWLGRVLPGDLIRFVIHTIVGVIQSLNLGQTDTTAKLIEQIIALATTIGAGAVIGALFFVAVPRLSAKQKEASGIVVGVLVGLAMLLIIGYVNFPSQADPTFSQVWVLVMFTAWGAAFNWVYNDVHRKGQLIKSDGTVIEVEAIDRRQFLIRLGGATATITFIGAGLGALFGQRQSTAQATGYNDLQTGPLDMARWSSTNELPNADAAVQPAPYTRPELTSLESHYRIDINSLPPVVDGSTWTLQITGLVENPMNMTMAQIQAYEPIDRFITLSCISNDIGGDLIGTQLWTGTSLKSILEDVRPLPEAGYIRITAADGFYEYVSVQKVMDDERIMLAYNWDGVPLEVEHGYPLRIWIPNLYGMKQPKWITGLEFVEFEQNGYWVDRGWDEIARVNTTSVIDTIAANDTFEQNGITYLPIGGIAYAGARRITKVEVRVDNGAWTQARLRTPIADTTWVIWRYDWAYTSGDHIFEVRATDGENMLQDETRRGVAPSGATGIHAVQRTLF